MNKPQSENKTIEHDQFEEPFEMQEWNDIGADLRIYIRRQFYGMKTQVQRLHEALALSEKRAAGLVEALEYIEKGQSLWNVDDYSLWQDARKKAREALSKFRSEG